MISFEFFARSASRPFTRKITLLNAVTGTGAGDYCDFYTLLSQFTCMIRIGGMLPTSVTVALEASLDGVYWASLNEVIVTTNNTMFHIINKPVRFIRANYLSKVGGDATTSVTFEVVAGGN